MKKGRPKNILLAKNRGHSVTLSVRAEIIVRQIQKHRPNTKWLNDLINKTLIDMYGTAEEEDREHIMRMKYIDDQRKVLDQQMQQEAAALQEARKKRKEAFK